MKIYSRIFCLIVFSSYQLLISGLVQETDLFAQTPLGIDLHQKINLAQKLYFEGNFDSAIDLIKQCLQQGLSADNEKVRAYKILAQAYLAKGFEQPAQEVVKKLLEIVPEYTPVLEEDPPQFVELVKKIKNAPAEKSRSTNNTNQKKTYWLWVGSAGVVILGATAILLLNGPESHNTDQQEPLPLPPAWPE